VYEFDITDMRHLASDRWRSTSETKPIFVEGKTMVGAREYWAAGIAAWAVVLGLVCESALGREGKSPIPPRDVKLMIHSQKISAEAGKYVLLPPLSSLTEGDAVPWYEKAVKALPDKKSYDQIRQWQKMPIDQLPADQVEQGLKAYIESFRCVAQAIKCRQCHWPTWTPGTPVANLEEYMRLASAIRLWARLELSNSEYDGAILALQTGFGMARQLGQGSSAGQAQLAVAIGGRMCNEIEEFVQIEGAPNLYSALAGLPRPFVDMERAIENEKNTASSEAVGKLASKQFERQIKMTYELYRAGAKGLDIGVAGLQCVEAIRSYAASHGGQLPQNLAEITEVSVPKDPVSGVAIPYTRRGAAAVLQPTAAVFGVVKVESRYEIVVKN
jgi:hypothetical protein